MQEIPGFSELIRRGGPENAQHTTLGEAYPLERLPDLAGVEAMCSRSFRDLTSKVYRCFQNRNGLVPPGNSKLFQLVLACRGRLFEAVHGLVIDSVVEVPHSQTFNDAELHLVSGIFFTASGDKPTHYGFSPLVMQRLMDQQELLCWTRRRIGSEQRYRQATLTLKAICAILVIVLLVQLLGLML
jgi:hypothetical protein